MNSADTNPYLDLLKRTLTRQVVGRPIERHTLRARVPGKRHLIAYAQRILGLFDWELVRRVRVTAEDYLESGDAAQNRAEDAETMLGTRQLDQMQAAILDVLARGVPGDLAECGVWRGGMTIFMRGVLKAMADESRSVWVVDSFEGLPDAIDDSAPWFEAGDMAASLDQVQANFARYELLDDHVHFLRGFFADTLPGPIRQLAILRIDADLYTSTRDALTALYPRLSPGGYCIVDDYRNLADCRRAVDEYRASLGETSPIEYIDRRAVYWLA